MHLDASSVLFSFLFFEISFEKSKKNWLRRREVCYRNGLYLHKFDTSRDTNMAAELVTSHETQEYFLYQMKIFLPHENIFYPMEILYFIE